MRYFNDFSCKEDVEGAFGVKLDNAAIVVASYANENYEGSAFVVFIENGKLYEVHGSHCSCNGLEDQWSPEETTVEALENRVRGTGGYVSDSHGEEFKNMLLYSLVNEIFEREVLRT